MKPELYATTQSVYKAIKTDGVKLEYIKALYQCGYLAIVEQHDHKAGVDIANNVRWCIEKRIKNTTKLDIWTFEEYCVHSNIQSEELNLYYDAIKLCTYDRFDSFMLYMERNRKPDKRFYLPRKDKLKIVVDDLQEFENSELLTFYGLSMPPRTGKSSVCIFFLAWIALRRPNSHSAMGGHSGVLAKGFYKELYNLFTSNDYTYHEMYDLWHKNHRFIVDKSAEEYTITLDEPDRFATITCRGIDGTWTGAVDISGGSAIQGNVGYLYVDDLIRDREHSLSPIRMETTFQEYLNKMVDRKNDGAKELMVGTLWNVLDPLERLSKMYAEDKRYKFRRIPALNENDESNFDYKYKGFSTRYYRDMRARLDPPEWAAKFQQKPYVREGLLFPPDELRYFNGILPEGDHTTVAVCDIAWGGGDSLSMPIGALYENGDCYIYAWVFNKGAKETTLPLVVGQIINNEIRQIRFEGNQGGDLYAQYVDERLKAANWKCATTSKKAPSTVSKVEKIVAYSGDIKRKFIFLSPTKLSPIELTTEKKKGIVRYVRDKEYDSAMIELNSFVTIGKNEHDDAPDSLTQLEMFIDGDKGTATAGAAINPFRTSIWGNL